ncbi:hypothetical protein B0H14DRAFT_3174683 [Mycena olivaceomarginata]|nr:hypothetical protein B0H14DRAFT_3174683 [Mycena olivaceomarginata]
MNPRSWHSLSDREHELSPVQLTCLWLRCAFERRVMRETQGILTWAGYAVREWVVYDEACGRYYLLEHRKAHIRKEYCAGLPCRDSVGINVRILETIEIVLGLQVWRSIIQMNMIDWRTESHQCDGDNDCHNIFASRHHPRTSTNSSGRVPARRPSKGKKAEKNCSWNGMIILECGTGSAPPSHSAEEARVDHQEDEHDDVQREKEGQTLQTGDEASGPSATPALVRDQCFIHHFDEGHCSIHRQTQVNFNRSRTSIQAQRRKAGDPLAGWAIELVPGDKTTAVSPREYAQKEPEEFAAQYPQYVKFL